MQTKLFTLIIEDYLRYQDELGVPVFREIKQKPKSEENVLAKISQKLNSQSKNFEEAQDLKELNQLINTCQKCALGKLRKNFVFGVGNPKADIVFVGEAPGEEEDDQGEPFVGRAGRLLTQMLSELGWKREEVFICNILKCRPPGNRDPLPEEVEKCEPYLLKQLDLIKPKMIIALGRIAGNTLLKKSETLAALRNRDYIYNGIKLFVTYHPAAVLRNPQWKNVMIEDFKKAKNYYLENMSK